MEAYTTNSSRATETRDPVAALVDERLKAEADFVGAMLARLAVGIGNAIAWGIDGSHFSDIDLRLVIDSAIVCHEAGVISGDTATDRERVLSLAVAAMKSAGIFHNGIIEHFANVADSAPWHPSYFARRARLLGDAIAKVTEARELHRRLAELMQGRAA